LIEKDRLTVADILREKGYRTGMVGKWHLGFDWYGTDGKIINGGLQLNDASFRKDAGAERVDVPNFPPYIWIENDRIQGVPSVSKPGEMYGHEGAMLPGWRLEEILPTLGRKAAEWIVQESKNEKPFFLYLPLTSPHTPITPSKAFQGVSGVSKYADFVVETDAIVGQVMKALEKTGAEKDTLVIFSTDNGTSSKANFEELEKHGVDVRYHFKGHKWHIHEGGHRVPFVVRWPGMTKPGSTCDEVVSLNDFMATVAELIGYRLPASSAEDSTSILSLITGTAVSLPERAQVVNHDVSGNFAIRKGRWKLVKSQKLYDLEADPKEKTDLSKVHPDLVKELAATLQRYRKNGRSFEGAR